MKRVTAMLAGGVLVVALWAPSVAAQEIKDDLKDIKQDRGEIRQDRQDIKENRQDMKDFREDRRDRREDRPALFGIAGICGTTSSSGG